MDKQVFKALVIIFVFLLVYQQWVSKFTKPKNSPLLLDKTYQSLSEDKLSGNIQENSVGNLLEEEMIGGKDGQEIKEVFGKFTVTYSPKGGYVKKIAVNAYQEELLYENIGFIKEERDEEFSSKITGNRLIFTNLKGQVKEYIFEDYIVKIRIASPPAAPVLVFSNPLISNMLEQRYQTVFYSQAGTVIHQGFKKIKEGGLEAVSFAGARDRYFCISLLKQTYEKIIWQKNKKEVYLFLPPASSPIELYIGPQTKKELQPLGLEGIMNYGFFNGIGMMMIKLLYFFYFITRNWGVSVMLLATAIYGILFPFTMKSTKAMKRMQELQPEIEELKKKYKDNPQKMNKETMDLYKKYKINPVGGCLPLFFQFPVFIALYQVLLRFIELKGTRFLWIKDLSLPDHAFTLPVTLPFIGEYINILPLFIIGISLVQQKFTTTAKASSPEQKYMGLFFSVFIGIIFYNFPSSLVLYWFIQNLFTLIYQIRLSSK